MFPRLAPALLLSFLGFSLSSSASLACEAGSCLVSTWPEPGQVDVPTDASIWLSHEVAGPVLFEPVLRDPEGNTVSLEVTYLFDGQGGLLAEVLTELRPARPLTPDTAYLLEIGAAADLCAGSGQLEFATGVTTFSPPAPDPFHFSLEGEFLDEAAVGQLSNCEAQGVHWSLVTRLDGPVPTDAVAWRLYRDGVLVASAGSSEIQLDLLPEDAETESVWTLRPVYPNGVEGPESDPFCWPDLGQGCGEEDAGAGDEDEMGCSQAGLDPSGLQPTWLLLLGLVAIGRRGSHRPEKVARLPG